MTLNKTEWLAQPAGAKAFKIKCYDEDGNFYGADYVIKTGDQEEADDLEQAKEFSEGYMYEVSNVIKN